MSEVLPELTPTQRRLLMRLFFAELARARAAALAAGVHEAAVEAAAIRRRRSIEAMMTSDCGPPEPDR